MRYCRKDQGQGRASIICKVTIVTKGQAKVMEGQSPVNGKGGYVGPGF